MPSALLLAHIEMWVAELEREVRAFEAAVEEVEEEMEKAERASSDGDASWEDGEGMQGTGSTQPIPRPLAEALARADHIAELVNAARATLDEALCAAQQVVSNERIDAPEVSVGAQFIAPSDLAGAIVEGAMNCAPTDTSDNRRTIRANLVSPLDAASPGKAGFEPLQHGATILAGRYRIVELLRARPRVNLYLAYRLSNASEQAQGAPSSSLVAIREIVLTGLPPDVQKRIEQAAFEEFVAPGLLGSPRLPGVGDRISVEHERHYLVMQLRPAREERAAKQTRPGSRERTAAVAVPLAELLLKHQQWPEWLDMETAFAWGVQLCRIVARLHRMGTVLGDLDPATILVNSAGPSSWAPVLLVSWPPALPFWYGSISRERYAQLFPIAENLSENAFAAPETLAGQADERSDVYSLGAILYLLFTRYAPAAAALRQPAEQPEFQRNGRHSHTQDSIPSELSELLGPPELLDAPVTPSTPLPARSPLRRTRLSPFEAHSGMALVPPHLFNNRASPRLESLLLQALALPPAERFPTVFALVEALEAIDPTEEFVDHYQATGHTRRDSKFMRALERVRGGENRGQKS